MGESNENVNLSEQHRQWKLNAAAVLHRYADFESNPLCETFDRVLNNNGLPARQSTIEEWGSHYFGNFDIVGEDTVEAFNAWKRRTARDLYDEAKRYGVVVFIDDEDNEYTINDVMVEAGFGPGYQEKKVRIEGKFSVDVTVKVFEGDNLIDAVPSYKAREFVYNHWNTDAVTWKVVDPSVK